MPDARQREDVAVKARYVAVLVAGLVAGPALAEEPNAFRGQAFAEQMCKGCHAIAKGETASPNSLAPPFAMVSTSQTLNSESFANWLGTAHPAINGIAIKPAIAADILAYIRSLEPQRQQAALAP
jgi:mono/diheme cytochrome c family protein